MRIRIEQLTPEQLESLSRTTRWRAQKRGWVCVAKQRQRQPRTRNERVDLLNYYAVIETLIHDAKLAARWAWNTLSFPRWFTPDDLGQEALLALLRQSGRPGFANRTWRIVVMRNRLRDLSRKRRELTLSTLEEKLI
jgi:DNA-directed RNA polymerase specialized sigma24 family protein